METHEIAFASRGNAENKIPVEPGGTYVFHAWVYGVDGRGTANLSDIPIDFTAVFLNGETFQSSPTTRLYLSSFGAWNN